MNLQLFGNGGDREQELRNAMLESLTKTTSQLASTLYIHTWKTRTTPDGNQIISLRASQRKQDGFASQGGWRTPTAQSDNSLRGNGQDPERRAEQGHTINLTDQVRLASWPTPQSVDIKMSNRGPEAAENEWNREHRGNNLALYAQHLSAWPTPQTHDVTTRGNTLADGHTKPHDLSNMAALAAWPTPNAMEGGQTSRSGERKDELLMGGMVQPSPEGPARLTISGKMLIGSAAGMDAGGQLWPGLPRFLMGLPPEWCKAAIAAHRKMKSVKKKSPRAKPG